MMGWPWIHFRAGVLPIAGKVLKQIGQEWKMQLLNTIAIPISFFLAFGLGMKDFIAPVQGLPYMVFLAPGLVSMTILQEAYSSGGWGIWLDRWHMKMLDEYRIKPIYASDILLGQILGSFTEAVVKGLIVACMMIAISGVSFSWTHLPAYFAYLLPGCLLFGSVGCLVGTVFRKPDLIAQTQTILITPLLYLGGLFFPVESFPSWLMPYVWFLPTTALFAGSRHALLYGTIHWPSVFGISTAAMLFFAIALKVFHTKLSE
jgi:lipooligosaccharide transport system permease protein